MYICNLNSHQSSSIYNTSYTLYSQCKPQKHHFKMKITSTIPAQKRENEILNPYNAEIFLYEPWGLFKLKSS